jgi:hypothetical protein
VLGIGERRERVAGAVGRVGQHLDLLVDIGEQVDPDRRHRSCPHRWPESGRCR